MQPNQQDPNQQPYVPPAQNQPAQPTQLPYQVPDYLHMDPVTGQVQKKSRKKLFVFSALVVIVLIIGGGVIFSSSTQPSTEQKFYDVLENLMQTSYFSQEISKVSSDANIKYTITGKAQINCSNPVSCKSTLNYDQVLAPSKSTQSDVKGEEIVTSKDSFYARITTSSFEKSMTTQLNQWYKVGSQSQGSGISDTLNLATYQGPLLIGNFDSNTRLQLLEHIKTNKEYVVTGSHTETINGQSTTEYDIETTMKKIADLNTEAIAVLKDKDRLRLVDNGEKVAMKVWVSSATKKVIRVQINTTKDDGSSVITKADLSYPSSVQITEPNNAKPLN